MSEKRCEVCHVGMPTFSKDEVQEKLTTLDGWEYDLDQNLIKKTFNFKGFYKTMAFVNAIAWIAQSEGHHPDMEVSYNKVVVKYTSHEAGGVTNNDLICAELVDGLL